MSQPTLLWQGDKFRLVQNGFDRTVVLEKKVARDAMGVDRWDIITSTCGDEMEYNEFQEFLREIVIALRRSNG